MHKKSLRHEIIIHAPPTKVWKVLTCSHYSQQFLFHEELHSDWTQGSPIVLKKEDAEKSPSFHQGMVEEVVPGISLQFSLYNLPELSHQPVQYQYELVPEEGGIRLILSQQVVLASGNLDVLLSQNCQVMLQKIKWLAEYSQ